MLAPKNNSKPRVLCPVGLHLCRLVQIIDLGNQRFKGQDPSRKLYFGFETLEKLHVFKEERGEEPFMLQVEYAFYMNASGDKKTKLRQFVESWFDKAFPSEEAASGFDFSCLLGRLAGVMVAHTTKTDGSKKASIVGIAPPEFEKTKIKWPDHNKRICYEIEHGEDGDFKFLPNFLQTKIRESDEFRLGSQQEEPEYAETGQTQSGGTMYEGPSETQDEPEDDIPFN